MRTRRLRLTSLALSAVSLLVVPLAGCSNGSGSGDDSNVSLRMTVWSNDKSQTALFDSIAAEYRKTHPDIRSITFDYIPIDNYTTALTTQIAGSNPPDMAWVLERDAPDFVTSGALTDLTPTLEKTAGYQYGDLTPAATKLWKQGGDLYAYPFSTSPFGMFYNKDLLKKAGVKQTPDQMVAAHQWTWQNAEQIAARVAAHTDKQGLVIRDWDYKTWIELAALWRGWGADAWSADGKTCTFDAPAMRQAMTFLHDAIFTDKALPGPGETADFFAGESALTVTQISRATLLANHPFDWGIVPLPSGPTGASQVIGQAGIGVLTKGSHKQQAADFLAYFSDPANSAKLARYFPPARTSQLTTGTLAGANPLFTPQQLQQVVIDGIKNGAVLPSHQDSAKIANLVQNALDPMWKAGANVDSVLAGVCKAIAPALSE
ncbi:ABC transporter substrate-binding protein [Streptomyces sp. NPDC087270]|uniref:ABC transporter substrate-binding protein n=1 Tax=Streptomyces sp. NPDC087270 TaxID=3365774 RepID=UPI00382B657E